MRKRRARLLAWTFVCGLLLLMMSFRGTGFAAEKKYKVVLVAHSTGVAFWVPVKKGMEDAAQLLGIEASFVGPLGFSIQEQRDILENVIESGVDGLGVTLPDPEAFDAPVKRAIDMGMPVVCFNTDDDTPNARMARIMRGEIEAGRVWAREIVKLIGSEGKVALLTEAPGQISLEQRLKGAREILDKTNIKYTTLNTTTDRTTAMGVIESYYTANPDVKGFFSVDTTGTPAAALFVKREGLKKKVVSGGFDLTPVTLEAIRDGYCAFTIDQNPYTQGWYTVQAVYLYLKYGIYPANIDTRSGIVDASNVDQVVKLAEEGYR